MTLESITGSKSNHQVTAYHTEKDTYAKGALCVFQQAARIRHAQELLQAGIFRRYLQNCHGALLEELLQELFLSVADTAIQRSGR